MAELLNKYAKMDPNETVRYVKDGKVVFKTLVDYLHEKVTELHNALSDQATQNKVELDEHLTELGNRFGQEWEARAKRYEEVQKIVSEVNKYRFQQALTPTEYATEWIAKDGFRFFLVSNFPNTVSNRIRRFFRLPRKAAICYSACLTYMEYWREFERPEALEGRTKNLGA